MPPTPLLTGPETLAREMHDVVGHALSVIAVQAGAARAQLDRDPGAAAAALDEVTHATATAVHELRALLRGLREDPALSAVLDDARRAGDRVAARIEPGLPAQPAGTAASIVREALTNARRHGAGGPVDVDVWSAPDGVRVRVANRMSDGPDTPGLGVRGMHERAGAVGGALRAGPDARGRWVVDAVLPEA